MHAELLIVVRDRGTFDKACDSQADCMGSIPIEASFFVLSFPFNFLIVPDFNVCHGEF